MRIVLIQTRTIFASAEVHPATECGFFATHESSLATVS
jgi:hypothetical protein